MTTRASDRTPSTISAVIAGAGIAGLATAITLARRGHAITLVEKRSGASEEGAGIQIGPNGMRILQALGLMPLLEDKIVWPDSIRVMDGLTGKLLTALPLGHDIATRHGAPYGVLHRADLHAALRDAFASSPNVTLRHGTSVADAETNARGVRVRLSDGESLACDLLIGADGIWSTLRRTVIGAAPLAFSGKCALRTVLPIAGLPAAISATDTTIWLRPAAHVVHYPVSGRRELAIVAIFDDAALGETWSQDVEADKVAKRVQSFPPGIRDLLLQPERWRQWSLYTPAAPFSWVKDRIVLIGDAAHPPLPFLAQGGVMALEDAAVLGALLDRNSIDIPSTLRAFEQIRRPRTTRVMQASEKNGRAYHLDGFMRCARNAVLAATPPHLFMRQYDWLYGWTLEDALKSARIQA